MEISFSKTSLKHLAKLQEQLRENIMAAIEGLPDEGDIQKMKGQSLQNVYRLRVGKYRVIYVRDDNALRVIDIDTRGDIYK